MSMCSSGRRRGRVYHPPCTCPCLCPGALSWWPPPRVLFFFNLLQGGGAGFPSPTLMPMPMSVRSWLVAPSPVPFFSPHSTGRAYNPPRLCPCECPCALGCWSPVLFVFFFCSKGGAGLPSPMPTPTPMPARCGLVAPPALSFF